MNTKISKPNYRPIE